MELNLDDIKLIKLLFNSDGLLTTKQKHQKLRNKISQAEEERKKNILLVGQTGTGKSYFINSIDPAFQTYGTGKVDAGKTFKSNTKQIIEGIKLRINAIELNIEREKLMALEADSKLPKYIIEGIKLSAMDTGGTLHTGGYQVIRHDRAGYQVSKHGTGDYQIAPVKLLTVQATILEDKEGAENFEKIMINIGKQLKHHDKDMEGIKQIAFIYGTPSSQDDQENNYIACKDSLNQNVRKTKKELTNAETDCVSKEKNVFLAKLSRKNGRTSIEKLNDELKMLKFRDPNVRFKIRAIKALKHKLQADGHL